jgi:hypothetical protein
VQVLEQERHPSEGPTALGLGTFRRGRVDIPDDRVEQGVHLRSPGTSGGEQLLGAGRTVAHKGGQPEGVVVTVVLHLRSVAITGGTAGGWARGGPRSPSVRRLRAVHVGIAWFGRPG